jgi:hypothetical protein
MRITANIKWTRGGVATAESKTKSAAHIACDIMGVSKAVSDTWVEINGHRWHDPFHYRHMWE